MLTRGLLREVEHRVEAVSSRPRSDGADTAPNNRSDTNTVTHQQLRYHRLLQTRDQRLTEVATFVCRLRPSDRIRAGTGRHRMQPWHHRDTYAISPRYGSATLRMPAAREPTSV